MYSFDCDESGPGAQATGATGSANTEALRSSLLEDAHNALKYYKKANQSVLEMRLVDTHMLEPKIIAGYINYKVALLIFAPLLIFARDSICFWEYTGRFTDLTHKFEIELNIKYRRISF